MAEENPSIGKAMIDFIKKAINKINQILRDRTKHWNKEQYNILLDRKKDLNSLVKKWEQAVKQGIKNQNAKQAVPNKKATTIPHNFLLVITIQIIVKLTCQHLMMSS